MNITIAGITSSVMIIILWWFLDYKGSKKKNK